MKTEFEVKILDINIDEIKKTLEDLRAEYVSEVVQKRYVYDFDPVDPNKWIRLRQKGETTELTIKQIVDDTITGTKEMETTVGDFETTNSILNELGYKPKAFQENKRISYLLDGVEVDIDFWPLIPPYLEIEGQNEQEIKETVEKLGFKMSDTTSINTTKVYENYNLKLSEIMELKFNNS